MGYNQLMQLNSRQLQIPFGFKYVQPEVPKWRPKSYSSFDSLVNQVIALRKGNSALLSKGLSTDWNTVANEVEQFNVKLCQNMGWTTYLAGGAGAAVPYPKASAPVQSQSEVAAAAGKVRKIWAGVRTINEWLDSTEPGVSQEQADKRAARCSLCKMNKEGDLSGWFTIPASEAIKRQLEKSAGRNLSTRLDSRLHLCTVCYCPLKLSVHVPLAIKLAHLSPEVEQELRQVKPTCWVIEEKDALSK